ncbi:thioredoxin family protein [Flavobacteriaceae bacterium]|jgi:peroxiredoxin|nr:thioredoxin family protein [Flavobacteriaceae bacterium]
MINLKLFFLTLLITTTLSAQNGYDIGDVATDFKLENVDNNFISLSDFSEAKGFILIFTCNTCPYAVAYEDRIEALNKKYATLGYPVVAVMPNNTKIKPGDSLEAMKKRTIEKGFTFPYLIDKEQSVFPQYGATKTPHVYILEKVKGENIVRYIGAIDDNYKSASMVKVKYVENAVEELLNSKDVHVAKTKAVGCSIKI